MKNIKEYLDYLYKFERLRMKYDLSNIKKILKALGNPEKDIKFIHISGTNGKGAVASFAASILMEHGVKTGLFTSPHIIKFNERIRVNGRQIDNTYIKNFINRNLKLFQEVKPSFFEVNTALAFNYFKDKKVDAAVIECGLGGRLDSTNVITPEVSVITQIAMDHEKYLGNTLHKIALEKLGIVKKNVPVVVSDNNTTLKKLFYKRIDNEQLIYLDDYPPAGVVTSGGIKSDGENLTVGDNTNGGVLKNKIPLPGSFQLRNAMASIITSQIFLEKNIMPISKTNTMKGLQNVIKNTSYHCRLETIKKDGCEFIFDVSHNPASLKNTFDYLKKIKINAVVFGMMEDKDYKSAMPYVLKLSGNIIFTKPSYHRSLNPDILYKEALKYRKHKNLVKTSSVKEAVNEVYPVRGGLCHKITEGKCRVLFCGSFFLVSDALKVLKLVNTLNKVS